MNRSMIGRPYQGSELRFMFGSPCIE